MAIFTRKDRQRFLIKQIMTGMAIVGPVQAVASEIHNVEAVIPPQCYTKTEGKFNPCYVCHQTHPKGTRVNAMADGDIQGDYSFSDIGVTNQWSNLFKPRAVEIAAISDDEILEYVRQDNYSDLLAQQGSGAYLPDLKNLQNPADAFDDRGLARDGSGWVAFNYKPVPSTFWPTNGNFDDVIIRLPEAFRAGVNGDHSEAIYFLNLSLVEMAIKDLDQISIPAVDERQLALDLDGDGELTRVSSLLRQSHYLGAASDVELKRQQYPLGTEFLHTVRYLDLAADGSIQPSRRMKEVRYSRKYKMLSEVATRYAFNMEHREKAEGKLPAYSWNQPATQAGMNNKQGWVVQGWIEDEHGALRLQNREENLFCMGCHTTIGTTIDSSFAFPRKVTGAAGWGYINLKGMQDAPSQGETLGEYLTYLERVGGGDEFRQNQEMIDRWFHADGQVKRDAVQAADVHTLITPSSQRALQLNKAYQRIVAEQSFFLGRDAVLGNPVNVYSEVDQDSVPVLPASRQFHYDLRLDWAAKSSVSSTLTASKQESNKASVTNLVVATLDDDPGRSGGALSPWMAVLMMFCVMVLRRR